MVSEFLQCLSPSSLQIPYGVDLPYSVSLSEKNNRVLPTDVAAYLHETLQELNV